MRGVILIVFMLWMADKAFANGCESFARNVHNALKQERIVPNKKNRVFLLGGFAYDNELYRTESNSHYHYDLKFKPTVGIGYQRKLTNDYNAGVIIQSNSAFFGTVGYDF